jgi:hypothetical protein
LAALSDASWAATAAGAALLFDANLAMGRMTKKKIAVRITMLISEETANFVFMIRPMGLNPGLQEEFHKIIIKNNRLQGLPRRSSKSAVLRHKGILWDRREIRAGIRIRIAADLMSFENIKSFLEKVAADKDLQEEVVGVGGDSVEAVAEALAKISKKTPFPFTAEEFLTAEQKALKPE